MDLRYFSYGLTARYNYRFTNVSGFRRGNPMWLLMGVFHSTKTVRHLGEFYFVLRFVFIPTLTYQQFYFKFLCEET